MGLITGAKPLQIQKTKKAENSCSVVDVE